MHVSSRHLAVCGLFAFVLFSPVALGQTTAIPVVKVEVTADVLELVKTWDEAIWFFTPSDKPLKSLQGLTRANVPFWGLELFERMGQFFQAAGIPGEGGQVMGDGAYNDETPKPPLYVTWSKYAPSLSGVARVEFIERKSP